MFADVRIVYLNFYRIMIFVFQVKENKILLGTRKREIKSKDGNCICVENFESKKLSRKF